MKEFHKVDLETGIITDVCLFDDEKDVIPTDCKLGWSEGFYNPVWDFELDTWVEGKPSQDILASQRINKIQELNITCETEIFSGFQATNGHLYEFETKDQNNLSQMLLLLSMSPTMDDVQWKTLDAGVQIHSRQDFMQVCMDAELHKRGNISKYWQLKGLVETAMSIEEIQAITW